MSLFQGLPESQQSDFQDRLNHLIAFRLRDALTWLRFPITMFLQRTTPEEDRQKLHQLMQHIEMERQYIDILTNAIANTKLRQQTEGTLVPKGITWIDWIENGSRECVIQCDRALQTYAGRAVPELVICLEELFIGASNYPKIIADIARNQTAELDGSVGRSYVRLLVEAMARADDCWLSLYHRYNTAKKPIT